VHFQPQKGLKQQSSTKPFNLNILKLTDLETIFWPDQGAIVPSQVIVSRDFKQIDLNFFNRYLDGFPFNEADPNLQRFPL
jgi:hypothetical protein